MKNLLDNTQKHPKKWDPQDGGMYGPLSAFLSTQLIRAKEMSEVEGWRQVDELNRRAEWFNRHVTVSRGDRARYRGVRKDTGR